MKFGLFFCDILFYIPACCFLCKPNSKIRTLYYLGIIINTRLTKLHQKYHILKREKTVSLPMSNKELFKIFCLTWSYHHLLLRLFLLTREMAGCANNLNFVPSLHCTTKGNCCAGQTTNCIIYFSTCTQKYTTFAEFFVASYITTPRA